MDKNEDQFLPAKRSGKKTNITNTDSSATVKRGNAKIGFGRTSSIMHQEGSSPIKYTGPWRMGGVGTVADMRELSKKMAPVFKEIDKSNGKTY